MVSLLYILSRHYSVLRNRALPAVIEQISENWFWPGPLRRRKTRRKVFKGCRDTLCAVVGLVVLFLLCSNSAAPPSPLADKWFPISHRLHLETIADKQAASKHLAHQQSSTHLQLDTCLATHCSYLFDAELCRQLPLADAQSHQADPSAVTAKHCCFHTYSNSLVNSWLDGTRPNNPTASISSTACMPAPSWALMLVPNLPVCPAVFPSSVLIVRLHRLIWAAIEL